MYKELKTLYGLPLHVEFCKKCTISNMRPNSEVEFTHTADTQKKTIHFENGVCDACRLAEQKKNIDWDVREAQLKKLCDRFRKNNGEYDVLVPGSGGKDSVYAAHIMKEMGMNVLTCTWSPHGYTPWGRENHDAWLQDFDNILVTPKGKTHRLLSRLAVDNLLHIFQPFVLGQKNLAPKIAAAHGIKLVMFGENESEYGNPIADAGKAKRDAKYYSIDNKKDIYLGGVSLDEIMQRYNVPLSDLSLYLPPPFNEDIEVHYAGYYKHWHPQSCYYFATEHGFKPSPERTPGTYSKYNSIDDFVDDYHYYGTYIKFGIGRATYDSAQEIRSGDLTREEGVALVKKYDGEYPARFEKEIFDYLNVDGFPKYDRESFLAHCETFKSSHLWDGDKLRYSVYA